MSIILLNLQSNQQIKLDRENSFIIGRENVEGCFDRRVSRNHGKITCTHDGKVRLAALHCNPCFFTRNGVPPVVQLNKDEEETLNEGDYLGLLPNAFWFKITSDRDKKIKTETDNTKTNLISVGNKKTSSPSESKSIVTFQADETIHNERAECITNDKTSKGSLNSLQVPTFNEHSNLAGSSNRLGTPEFEKTRRLPLKMYEIDEPIKSNYRSPNKRSQLSDGDEIEKKCKLLSESEIKKECETGLKDVVKIENEITNLDFPSTSKVENIEESSTAVFESPTENQSNAQVQREPSRGDNKKEGYESDVENVEENEVKRPICQYERNCYRKNPQHKLKFCHPGDSDYVPYKERPLCQYGTTCFRRNEKHRMEFRHSPCCSSTHNLSSSSCSRSSIGEERPPCLNGSSCLNQNPQHRKDMYHPPKASSPLPLKRRRKKVKAQNVDYGSDDEDDVEDPFINDASSDEYVPSDLDSDEEEEEEEESLIISQEIDEFR